MSRFVKFVLGSSTVAASGFAAYAYPKVYKGEFVEESPYNASKLSFVKKVTHRLIGTNDDITQSKTIKLINPNNNEVVYDYYEKRLDTETTKRILAKYNTNEEILAQLQKGVLLGPTFWFNRYVLSPYFKNGGANNRIAGFTKLEPELKELKVESLPKVKFFDFPLLPDSKRIKYLWDGEQVKQNKSVLPINTIVYGLYDFVNYGKRSNGGFFEFTFGSDLLPVSIVHRIDYYTVKNGKGEDNLVVRITNGSVLVPPKSPRFVHNPKGLYELLSRTVVLDAIRGLTTSL